MTTGRINQITRLFLKTCSGIGASKRRRNSLTHQRKQRSFFFIRSSTSKRPSNETEKRKILFQRLLEPPFTELISHSVDLYIRSGIERTRRAEREVHRVTTTRALGFDLRTLGTPPDAQARRNAVRSRYSDANARSREKKRQIELLSAVHGIFISSGFHLSIIQFCTFSHMVFFQKRLPTPSITVAFLYINYNTGPYIVIFSTCKRGPLNRL